MKRQRTYPQCPTFKNWKVQEEIREIEREEIIKEIVQENFPEPKT